MQTHSHYKVSLLFLQPSYTGPGFHFSLRLCCSNRQARASSLLRVPLRVAVLDTRHIAQLFSYFLSLQCACMYMMCVHAPMSLCLCLSVVHVEVKKQLEKLVLTVYLCVGPGHQAQVSRLTQQRLYLPNHLFSPVNPIFPTSCILFLVPLAGRPCAVGI